MKKSFFLFILISGFRFCFPYVSEEPLFGQTFIFKGVYDSVMSDRCIVPQDKVVLLNGMGQFVRYVLQNERPVVIKIFRGGFRDLLVESVCQDAAKEFSKQVSFFAIDIAEHENSAIIQRLMGQVGVVSISVPFFLFFKQQELMLPPVVFPPMYGIVEKEIKERVREDFFQHIRRQFFLGQQAVSTLDKIGKLSEKVSQWLTGFRNVSCKEVKAYHLSKKH
jgi:hypothetical protein